MYVVEAPNNISHLCSCLMTRRDGQCGEQPGQPPDASLLTLRPVRRCHGASRPCASPSPPIIGGPSKPHVPHSARRDRAVENSAESHRSTASGEAPEDENRRRATTDVQVETHKQTCPGVTLEESRRPVRRKTPSVASIVRLATSNTNVATICDPSNDQRKIFNLCSNEKSRAAFLPAHR